MPSPSSSRGPRALLATVVIPGALLAFQLATYAGYGYFRDELYYLANGRHLGFGYVDHPPLIGLIAAFVERFLGTSLLALRFLPALAHALTASIVAGTAREMGGGRKAQSIAAVAVAVAPIMLGLFGYFSMNAFDLLCWATLTWIAARYLRTGTEAWWLPFGLVAGVGLENKISVLFLGFGLVCGLLAAGPRTAFRRPWLWAAGVLAVLLFLPHVLWQAANGWPTLEFIRNASEHKNVALSPVAFLTAVALHTLPTLPIWLAGLGFLLVARAARPFRALGLGFVAVLGVMLATNAKPYYLAPAFAILFAAGGVAFERLGTGRLAATVRGLVVGIALVVGVLLVPFSKGVLSEDAFVAYSARLGVRAPQEERGKQARLPQSYADMHGWQEMAAAVGQVYHALPADERAQACIFTQNYGEAGAIDLFGRAHGLPPAISGHNSYFLWGAHGCTGQVLIVLGGDSTGYPALFSSVERAATFTCRDCMPYESDLPIWVLRGPKVSLKEIWPKTKHFM
jgi:hypothetical protein